jgi:hypothetical protein
MKRILISVVLASAMFSVGAMAQSAKFAAVWTDGSTVVRAEACAEVNMAAYCEEGIGTDDDQVGLTLATIKVPQSKELLVGISAQVGLFTETVVKGKRGSQSTALAAAAGSVTAIACNDTDCYEGKPGPVVLNSRSQELSAVLAGIIEECTFDVELDVVDDVATGDATWDLSDCIVADEEISLALDTVSANHFNFVFPDLPQGDYEVVARFETTAHAEAEATCPESSTYCLEGDGAAAGHAIAWIGKTMMTIQEVRAVKGSLGSTDFDIVVE